MTRWTIDAEALRHVCPDLGPPDAAVIAGGLGEAFHRFGIDSRRRAAMAVAQWAHESDRFRTSTEYASGAAYEGRKDLGNTHAGDGRRFRGRGRIMITGRANYAAMGAALDLDLIRHPELLARSPNSELASGQWWRDHDCNRFCDRDDFTGLTRCINGGLTGLASRRALYALAREVAGGLLPRDRWAVLTDQERAAMEALTAERHLARSRGGWNHVGAAHLARARGAAAWLAARRERLRHAAEREPGGWDVARRRERHRLIDAVLGDGAPARGDRGSSPAVDGRDRRGKVRSADGDLLRMDPDAPGGTL